MKSKTFLSADITGTPILSVQEEMKTVMLRDDDGLLSFLRIKTTGLTTIVINEVLIEENGSNDYLKNISLVSMGKNFMVTYGSESINYF